MKFKEFCEARNHQEIIKALRAKTVERGATEGEAKAAAAKADELEKRHSQNAPFRPNHKNPNRRHWTKGQWRAQGFDPEAMDRADAKKKPNWSKERHDAWMDARERDEKN
jgi:hypothetical protein